MHHCSTSDAQYVRKFKKMQHCAYLCSLMQHCIIWCANFLQIFIIKMADAQNEELVDTKCLKLLVRTRLDMEEEFVSGRKKKTVLWGRILEKMKEARPNLDLNEEQLNRKFLNLQTTYKRIKNRNKESGRNSTAWEFFDEFDEVYGTRHSITPPSYNLVSSLDDSIEETENNTEPVQKRRKTNHQNEILTHLQQESEKEQKRHDEIIAIGRKKMEIEEKRIDAILQLKNVLEKTINKT